MLPDRMAEPCSGSYHWLIIAMRTSIPSVRTLATRLDGAVQGGRRREVYREDHQRHGHSQEGGSWDPRQGDHQGENDGDRGDKGVGHSGFAHETLIHVLPVGSHQMFTAKG